MRQNSFGLSFCPLYQTFSFLNKEYDLLYSHNFPGVPQIPHYALHVPIQNSSLTNQKLNLPLVRGYTNLEQMLILFQCLVGCLGGIYHILMGLNSCENGLGCRGRS